MLNIDDYPIDPTDDIDSESDEPKAESDAELLKKIRKCFSLASEYTSENRQAMLDDIRFARLGDQWTEATKYDRNRPGKERPMLVVNRLLQFRNKVVNEIRQNTPSIRIRPVSSGADQETADVIMGLIRHIQDNSNASIAYDSAVEWQVDMGLGYIKVRNGWVDGKSFDQDIFIDRIPDPFKVYFDPHSTHPDGSDAEWCIIAEEISKDEFKRLYPGIPQTQFGDAGNGDMQGWYSTDSVRIAEYYWIEHEMQEITEPATGLTREADTKWVRWAKVTGDTVLEQTDIPGGFIPIIPVVGQELFLEGRRYLNGLIRNAKDPQRLYNYYLSANAENVALSPKAPFIGVAGQFETDPNWGRANKESVAYLEYDPVSIAGSPVGAPQRAMPPQASSAIMQAIQLAENDVMQSMGIYQPSLGAQSNETSGRALFLRQKQADIATYHYQDNLNRSIRQVGRVILGMIPHVYDRPRIARILGEDGTSRQVQLNPDMPQASMNTENPAIESVFNPGVGIYDVVCDAGPSYSTRRDEAAQMMLSLTQANPSLFGLIGDLMVRNMDWPGAEEIANRLQLMLPPQLQAQNKAGDKVSPELLQAHQAIEQLAGQMEHMGQEIAVLRETRNLEIQEKQRQWYDSETKRMDVEARIMGVNIAMNQAAGADALRIMANGAREAPEEIQELEAMESTLEPPEQQPMTDRQSASMLKAPAMTRKPDIAALAGDVKPGENKSGPL